MKSKGLGDTDPCPSMPTFNLVTALCTACFSRAKINKKLRPSTLRFGPPTWNALAPALILLLPEPAHVREYCAAEAKD